MYLFIFDKGDVLPEEHVNNPGQEMLRRYYYLHFTDEAHSLMINMSTTNDNLSRINKC